MKKPGEGILSQLLEWFEHDFPNIRGRVTRLENGPPVVYPVQFRITGQDPQQLKELANKIIAIVRANPYVKDVDAVGRK